MAAAIIGRNDVEVNEFGRDVEVPENPIAKLMYYFDSICYAMDLNRETTPDQLRKLRNYSQYRKLNQEERELLLILCVRFSPDELINKCLFQDDDMCGNAMNKFYKLDAVQKRFLITEEVIIGGQTTRVVKILCFRKIWLEFCYLEPMKNVQSELRSIAGKLSGRPSSSAAQQRRGPPSAPRLQQQRAPSAPRQRQQPQPQPQPEKKDDGCLVM